MKKQKGKHDCYVKGAQGVYGVCTGGLRARLCQTRVFPSCECRKCCVLVVSSGSMSKGCRFAVWGEKESELIVDSSLAGGVHISSGRGWVSWSTEEPLAAATVQRPGWAGGGSGGLPPTGGLLLPSDLLFTLTTIIKRVSTCSSNYLGTYLGR